MLTLTTLRGINLGYNPRKKCRMNVEHLSLLSELRRIEEYRTKRAWTLVSDHNWLDLLIMELRSIEAFSSSYQKSLNYST